MTAARIHLALAAVWFVLVIPTVLWWRDSVLWVSIASLYANVVSHLAAAEAARAEQAAEKASRK